MAWGDPKTLEFDVSKISSMRKELQDTKEELNELKTTLIQEIAALKRNWKTPAGKKFTKNVDLDWAKQIERYIVFIGAVDELLQVAETDYKEVEEKAKTISF